MKKETPACVAMHPTTRRWFAVDATAGDYRRAAARVGAEFNREPVAPIVGGVVTIACLLAVLVIDRMTRNFPWWLLAPIAAAQAAILVDWRIQKARQARAIRAFGEWLDMHNAQPIRSMGRAGVESIATAARMIDHQRREATKGARWAGASPNTGATELEELARSIRRHVTGPGDRTLTAMGRRFERAESAYGLLVACNSHDIQGRAHLARIMARGSAPAPWTGPRGLGWI